MNLDPRNYEQHPPSSWEPDPEDFEPAPVSEPTPLERLPAFTQAVPAIGFLILCFFATTLYNSNSPIRSYLAANGESVFGDEQYWRLVTSVLTHSDLLHLASNAPLLFIFGWFLRAFFGARVFPVLSLVLGTLTTLGTIYFYPPHLNLVGASGMAYAMVGVWLAYYVRFDTRYEVGMRIFRALGFAIVMLIPTTFQPNTSYLAHGIGFLLGLLTALVSLLFVKPK